MATTNKIYTLMEGSTTNGGYGKLELRLSITPNEKENSNEIIANLYFILENSGSDDITLELGSDSGSYLICSYVRNGVTYYTKEEEADTEYTVANTINYKTGDLLETSLTGHVSSFVAPGASKEIWISKVEVDTVSGLDLHSNLDGTLQLEFSHGYTKIWDVTNDKRVHLTTYIKTFTVDIPQINRAVVPVTANNFTDEENPTFTYEASIGESISFYLNKNKVKIDFTTEDTILSLQAGLSFDGETIDIPYRDIPVSSTGYTFDLTEAEREILRQKAQGSPTVPIYYMTRVVRAVEKIATTSSYIYKDSRYYEEKEFIDKTERILTIINCNPSLNPTVKDIHARANYLTGSENKFIKYVSIAEFTTGATANKHATIVSQQVINGSHTVNNLSSGTIEGVDSNTFYFSVTDSRNLTTRDAIVVDLVPYVKLTARISEADLGTDGALTFTVTGNYYNGSFGAVNNSLGLEYSLRVNNGDITQHIADNISPSFSGNTYTITHRVEGFTYRDQIVLTVKIIDKITSVQTNPKAITSIPVFDWSETDFRHRTDVFLERGKKLKTYNIDDNELDLLAIDENTNNVTFGIETTNTTIQGSNINLVSSNPITLNGTTIGANKVLWSGASYMNANQSINLSEAISEQTNGIVLVFSLYRNNSAEDVSINSFFVSKKQIELLEGAPHSFFMLVNAGFSILGAKYLYINDSSISGHEDNTSSGTNSGITFDNSNYVLRYVIGV